MRTKSLEMIPLEVICRNIATGSLLKKYPFEENQKLDPPVLQFDYKNDEYLNGWNDAMHTVYDKLDQIEGESK